MEKFIISSIAWAWLFAHLLSFLAVIVSLIAWIWGVPDAWRMLLTFIIVKAVLEFIDYGIEKQTGFNGLTDWLKDKTN